MFTKEPHKHDIIEQTQQAKNICRKITPTELDAMHLCFTTFFRNTAEVLFILVHIFILIFIHPIIDTVEFTLPPVFMVLRMHHDFFSQSNALPVFIIFFHCI